MRLLLKDAVILGFVETGELMDSIEFEGAIPEDFYQKFKPDYYLIKNNEIERNPDYIESTLPEPDIGPSAEMVAINALGLQVAKLMAEKGGN